MVKKFDELTAQGQKSRLAKYAKEDAKYGVTSILARVTRIADNGTKVLSDGRTVHRFGFNLVALNKEGKDLIGTDFVWGNQMIDVEKGSEVIAKIQEMKAKLATPETKSILVSAKIKNDVSQYININSIFERTPKKQQATEPEALPY